MPYYRLAYSPARRRLHPHEKRQKQINMASSSAKEWDPWAGTTSPQTWQFLSGKNLHGLENLKVLSKISSYLDATEIQTEVHNHFLADIITNVYLAKLASLIEEQRKWLGMNWIWRLWELQVSWQEPGKVLAILIVSPTSGLGSQHMLQLK